jgi:hypothetical protein
MPEPVRPISEQEAHQRAVPHHRYVDDRVLSGRERRLDRVSLALAIVGVLLSLRLDGRYSLWPLLGLALPAVRLIASRAYRRRSQNALTVAWARLSVFSTGQGPLPWRESIGLVGVPFFLLNLAHGAILGAVDTQPVAPTAVSLVREGNVDLSEFLALRPWNPLTGRGTELRAAFQRLADGRILSAFPPGMVPWATVVAIGSRLVGADFDRPAKFLRLEKITASVVASAVLTLFFLAACRLGSPAPALVTTLMLATGSAVLTTVGLGLWQHGGVAFWLLAALLIEFISNGHPSRWVVVLQSVALAQMLACRPTAALLVGMFGLWVLARQPRRAVALGLLTTVTYLPWVAFYAAVYGNPFGPQTMLMNSGGQFWSFFQADRILGVLACPARGLFVYQPWALLGLVALGVPSLRGCGPRGWPLFAVVAVTAHVLIIAAWHDWSGGWCWGSRLLTEINPLLGLLAVPVVAVMLPTRPGRAALIGLAMCGLVVHLPAITRNAGQWNAVTDHDADLWSWSNAPFRFAVRP